MIQERNKETRLNNLALARERLAQERAAKKAAGGIPVTFQRPEVELEPLPPHNTPSQPIQSSPHGEASKMLSSARAVKRKIQERDAEEQAILQAGGEQIAPALKKVKHGGSFSAAIRSAAISTLLTLGGIAFTACLPLISEHITSNYNSHRITPTREGETIEKEEKFKMNDIFRM